jgi:hypothetical protein
VSRTLLLQSGCLAFRKSVDPSDSMCELCNALESWFHILGTPVLGCPSHVIMSKVDRNPQVCCSYGVHSAALFDTDEEFWDLVTCCIGDAKSASSTSGA